MKRYFIIVMLFFVSFLGCGSDVITTKSGLKYSDEKVGEGKAAAMGDVVTMHLTIWLVKDSTDLFGDWNADSLRKADIVGTTKDKNQPAKIVLGSGNFVKGSDEGIVGMKPGGVRTIIIPSELAYGTHGAGPVPPNTDLRLQIEMIDAKAIPAVEPWNYDSTKVVTTPSGLKYVILQEGQGENADSNDIVTVHYSGFLMDGKKFDSSVERDDPFILTLGRNSVIPGWEEGLTLLKKGSKAKLIIPSNLAYGERDMGVIPPNSTLIFDVEILDIKKN